ncbi:MAG TPA: DUF6157 family protein [Oculatellaceae cyanobacterium]|jgi:hypothetical protein
MLYKNTFILVSDDCPVSTGIIPARKGDKKTIAMIQYELLTQKPYQYNHLELAFESFKIRQMTQDAQFDPDDKDVETQFFKKNHPCMRTSPLAKQYGWGVHHDENGKIAIYAKGSKEYARFSNPQNGLKIVKAVANKRAKTHRRIQTNHEAQL